MLPAPNPPDVDDGGVRADYREESIVLKTEISSILQKGGSALERTESAITWA